MSSAKRCRHIPEVGAERAEEVETEGGERVPRQSEGGGGAGGARWAPGWGGGVEEGWVRRLAAEPWSKSAAAECEALGLLEEEVLGVAAVIGGAIWEALALREEVVLEVAGGCCEA